jgi:bifunctional non-homologous end joining protein LigD
MQTHTNTTLHFREGASDKEYHAAIQQQDDGFIVTFKYGRRGSTLTHGTKTTAPVPLAEAIEIHRKLVASKTAKGYQELGARVSTPAASDIPKPRVTTLTQGSDTGIRCQLLNPIDDSELRRMLTNQTHCLQQKHDGRRVLVRKKDGVITGINRRGLVIELPDAITAAAAAIGPDCLIDGEAVGDTLHAFDLLELDQYTFTTYTDLRPFSYLDRYRNLLFLLDGSTHRGIEPVRTAITPADKRAMYQTCRALDCEGVVFKDINAPATPGRPNSGGTQLKYKFVASASFIVIGINAKRSVSLGLYDTTPELVRAGNVTIPPNHEVPAMKDVVEVKYLYAFRESGSVYQPVYAGKRADIPRNECLVSQLKYKAA